MGKLKLNEGGKKNMRLAVFIVLAVVVYFTYMFFVNNNSHKNIDVGKDVTITVNGEVYENVSTSKFSFTGVEKGDMITIHAALPESDIYGGMIELRVYHCVVHAYIDDECIYSFGDESAEKGVMLGSGTHFIPLPGDYSGKEIDIELIVTEKNAVSTIGRINFQSQIHIFENFVRDYFFQILIAVFVFGMGVMLVGLAIVFGGFNKEHRVMLWMTCISLSSSIWIMASTGIIQVMVSDFRKIGYIEYVSLDLMLFFFLIFAYDQHYDKRVKKIIAALAVATAVFIVVSLILDVTNIAHLPATLQVLHMLSLIAMIVIITASLVTWFKDRNSTDGILLKGIVLMLVVLIFELLRFNLQKYFPDRFGALTVSILPVGIIVFVVSMFSLYINRLMQTFHQNIENQTLMHMAYTDALTGIANRAKCEKVLEEFNDNAKEYTLFNFDLNDFKEINDTYGHATGDKVLIHFARLADKIFDGRGFFGRMGGDEFIALIATTDEKTIEQIIAKIHAELDKLNQEDGKYNLSVSIGYHMKHKEDEASAWDVYKLADEIMYENKGSHRR